MALIVVSLVSFAASLLTLFTGFGLGTLLLPAFTLFFAVEAAVAMTAIVHLANNLFKLALLGRHADSRAALLFGLPAAAAAWGGARLLAALAGLPAVGGWSAFGRDFDVRPLELTMGALMLGFAAFETAPALARLSFERRWLPLGGLLSGFFGGLSGHQGAMRSAFLLRAGLSQEAFVATGVVCACLVDAARLSVYGRRLPWDELMRAPAALGAAALAAFLGAWLGSRLLLKSTVEGLRRAVAAALAAFGAALAAGLI